MTYNFRNTLSYADSLDDAITGKDCIARLYFVFLLLFMVFNLSACSVIGGYFSSRQEFEYIVRKGDTLFEIASDFDVTVEDILSKNHISNPDKLQVGQILIIPASSFDEVSTGGPYISASRVKKERANIVMPDLDSIQIEMSMPVISGRIASKYGARGDRFHEGVDIIAKEGTDVYSAHDGVVIFSGNKLSGYGNMVVVKSGQIMTLYAHNSVNFVEGGQNVRMGEKLAEVGSTGRATGPHLHFEVRVKANNNRYYAVDPLYFIRRKK